MSFDDELRDRMRNAAEQAGTNADPAAAAARVASATSSSAAGAATTLKIIGGLGAIGLVAGAILGATVLRPEADVAVIAAGIDVRGSATFDCPNGATVGSLRSGDRVFVIGRDDGGTWSAIRRPDHIDTVVWVPVNVLSPDDEPTDVPVVDCTDEPELLVAALPSTESVESSVPDTTLPDSIPESTEPEETVPTTSQPGPSTTVPRTSTPTPPPTPAAPPPAPNPTAPAPATTAPPPAPTTTSPSPPPPPADTQQPTLQASTSSSKLAPAGSVCPTYTTAATLSVSAQDNVGVSSVNASWGPSPSGSTNLSRVGGNAQNGTWQATIGPFNGVPPEFAQNITVTLAARDSAGNARSTTLTIFVVGTNCDFG